MTGAGAGFGGAVGVGAGNGLASGVGEGGAAFAGSTLKVSSSRDSGMGRAANSIPISSSAAALFWICPEFCTATMLTAPPAAFAVRSSPGGTTGNSGAARLPQLQPTAALAQAAGSSYSFSSAASMAALRLASVRSSSHFSAMATSFSSSGSDLSVNPQRTLAHDHSMANSL